MFIRMYQSTGLSLSKTNTCTVKGKNAWHIEAVRKCLDTPPIEVPSFERPAWLKKNPLKETPLKETPYWGNVGSKESKAPESQGDTTGRDAFTNEKTSSERAASRTFYELDEEGICKLAAEFAEAIPENTLTPGQLQGFFQMHLDSPVEARNFIESWVDEQETASW
jgi:hypothetical protein